MTIWRLLQLIGAGCVVVVVLTHVAEAFKLLPIMGWGLPALGIISISSVRFLDARCFHWDFLGTSSRTGKIQTEALPCLLRCMVRFIEAVHSATE